MLRREKDIKSAAAFDTLLLRLSAQTHDPHSTVFGGSLGWQGDKFLPPLSITWIDSSYYLSAIYDSTYSRYLGKSISAINERPIHDLIEVHKPYVAGQGQAYVNQHIATFYLLPGDSGSAFHVKLNDGGSLNTTRSLSFDTYRAWETQHKMQERTNGLNKDSILYINLGISITSTWLKEQFKTAKATILDLRQYPTWRNFKLLRYFLDKNTDSCVSVDPDVHYLLKDKSYSQALARKAKHPVPIYILISENTVSRSEYFAAILKTYNSTACLIGSPTVGAMGEFAQVPMYGDLSVSFTCGEVTFDGRSYFKQGLQPDITVHQQPSDIRGGIDRVLNTALDRARRMAH
ncbi:MAG: hypothetical protein JST83_17625 [Bacteroidetes bacterium]|nr:hypothetical protein [Bacteroidota bacterium]